MTLFSWLWRALHVVKAISERVHTVAGAIGAMVGNDHPSVVHACTWLSEVLIYAIIFSVGIESIVNLSCRLIAAIRAARDWWRQ